MSDMLTLNGKEYEKDAIPDSLTFILRRPIKVGDFEVETIDMMEPNAGEYELFVKDTNSSNFTTAMIKMISRIAAKSNKDLSEPTIKLLAQRDLNDMAAYLLVFINPGQTSKKQDD